MLLTPAQTGPGFQASKTQALSGSSFQNCPALAEKTSASDTVVSTLYGDSSPAVTSEILAAGNPAELNTDVDQLSSASVQCKDFTGTVLGTTLTFVVVPLRISIPGDRQAAVRVTAELPGQPVLVEDVATVRHEKVLMFYSYAARQVDQQTFEVLLQKAYAKLVAHY